MVLAAGGDSTLAGDALERLCAKYWPPLFGFALRSGLSRETAEDAVQGFILIVIQRGSLGSVEREGARFRSWLLGGFVHHLANVRRHESTAKRGGGSVPLNLEEAESYLPPSGNLTPEEAYDQAWARLVLTSAMRRLKAEQQQAGKADLYALLESSVLGQSARPHAELARLSGLSESNVSVIIHRLRLRLRDILRAEVAHTVGERAELDDEIGFLTGILQRH